ncbi:hypothetical protein ACFLX6_01960 [Chloroflexota bacterium]
MKEILIYFCNHYTMLWYNKSGEGLIGDHNMGALDARLWIEQKLKTEMRKWANTKHGLMVAQGT